MASAHAEGAGAGEGLHLAFFIQQLRGGGVPRMTLNLAAELQRRGVRTTVVLAMAGGALADAVPEGVASLVLGGSGSGRRGGRKWRVLSRAPGLASFLRRERPDALVAADHWANFSAVLAHGLARSRARLVLTQRVPLSVRAAEQPLVGRLARALYPRADALVGVSEGVADDLRARLPSASGRVSTIYNPVVTPGFPERIARPAAHPWLGDGGPPVLVNVGRLIRQKDHPTLLRALARVRERRELRLVVFGDGPRLAALEDLAGELGVADAVSFAGFTKEPLPEIARAAAFVLSSAFEGFGNVLVEALACGCPVVSTDCPSGPAEILVGGEHGRLVPVGDDEALANAIERTLDAPADREARRRRAEAFSVAAAADGYLELVRPAGA